jgi:azurin
MRFLFLAFVMVFAFEDGRAAPGEPNPANSADTPKTLKVEIKIVPGVLRFATARFDATATGAVELTVNNTCIMVHNFVLAAPGRGDAVVAASVELGTEGMAKNFVPASRDVLAATKLLSPGQFETLKFTAPSEPGDYPYLCTFPGHGTVMRGVMRVRPKGEELEASVVESVNAPKVGDTLKDSGVTPRPIGTRDRPFIMRSFVPNPGLGDEVLAHHDRGLPAQPYNPNTGLDRAGKEIAAIPGVPAGIAVSFGPDFAYVWDATECRLLYAWSGGFLNMAPYWGPNTGGSRRSRNYVPLIEGTLIFKTAGAQPLRLGAANPGQPKFRGYRLVGGSPEFSYRLNDKTVHELIIPADPGTFMVHYRVDDPPSALRLVFDASIRPQIACEQGTWNGNTLEIPADRSAQFMLLVRFQRGETFKPVDAAEFKKSDTSEEP